MECKKLTAGRTAVPSPLHPLHWNTLGLAPGLRAGQPVANRLVTTAGSSMVHLYKKCALHTDIQPTDSGREAAISNSTKHILTK